MTQYTTTHPVLVGLKPYESNRYRIENEMRGVLGYVSRFYSDGKSKWYAWTDDGLHSEVRTFKAGVATIAAERA